MDVKYMHLGDVVAFRTIDDKVSSEAAMITSISRNGETVELMIPDIRCQETYVKSSTIEELSAIGEAYRHAYGDATIEMYENLSKIYGEMAKMLREATGSSPRQEEQEG